MDCKGDPSPWGNVLLHEGLYVFSLLSYTDGTCVDGHKGRRGKCHRFYTFVELQIADYFSRCFTSDRDVTL